jgi:hypothetical protein
MWLGLIAPTWACLFEGDEELLIDSSLEDSEPPSILGPVLDIEVYRGEGPEVLPGGIVQTESCDDFGHINLSFSASTDDQGEPGYEFTIVAGTPPADFYLPSSPVMSRIEDPASFHLIWIDGGTDIQEAFSFTLGIWAVDQAGNYSERLDVFIADAGRAAKDAPEGCSTTQAPLYLFFIWLLLHRQRNHP